MLAQQLTDGWIPASPADRALVLEQLERLLAAPHFSSSKRYPSFLRFVVTHALSGQTDLLKERILGVELFARSADYDTTTDPIVRVTAAEIRKRIEQYYQEAGHDLEIRISLPSGSYVPQFSHPGKPPTSSADDGAIIAIPKTLSTETKAPESSFSHFRKAHVWWSAAILALFMSGIAAGSLYIWDYFHVPVLKAFWAPFVKAGEPILFCIADQSQYSTIKLRDAADPQRQTILNDSLVTVIIDDVGPLINIAGMLHTYGKTYRVQGETTTSLTDLRHGPSVFIGAFDNGWTLRLTSPLRFHFANNSDMTRFWIEDRSNPDKQDWVLDRNIQQQTGTYKDYAIVARFIDPNTDQFAVVVAGIGRGGTVAGGEFLVDPNRMNEILSYVPKGWDQKNIEIILETQIIQGRSGPPRVVTAHIW